MQYNIYESTLKITKPFTNGSTTVILIHLDHAFFVFLITLNFHELNECGGKLFYFLSNVVCLYVHSILQLMDKLLKCLFSIKYG